MIFVQLRQRGRSATCAKCVAATPQALARVDDGIAQVRRFLKPQIFEDVAGDLVRQADGAALDRDLEVRLFASDVQGRTCRL